MAENLDGYFGLDEHSIRAGMSEVQTVCAAVHEITHSILHNQRGVREDKAVRTAWELEAESVSYVVCQYCGVETETNSFGYLASWSKDKELSELRAPVWRPSIRQPISSSVRLTATSPRSARSAALSWNRKMRRKFRRISRAGHAGTVYVALYDYMSWKPPGCCNTPIRWTPGSRRTWRSWRSCGRAILPTSVIRWTV